MQKAKSSSHAMDAQLTRRVYEHLRHGLGEGRWQPGDRISGNLLAQELGVSRTPVRDAMQQLATEGLVHLRAKSAAHVRELSLRDLRDCMGLRQALEPFAAGRAARRVSAGDVRQLRDLLSQMRPLARAMVKADCADTDLNQHMQQLDARFHRIILMAAGNPRLLRLIETDRLLTRKLQYPSQRTAGHVARTLLEHWRIYRAIRRGDGRGARRAMATHIRTATRSALQRH